MFVYIPVLQAVGKFPAYKELFSEYVWSDSGDTAEEEEGTHTTGTQAHPDSSHSIRGLICIPNLS